MSRAAPEAACPQLWRAAALGVTSGDDEQGLQGEVPTSMTVRPNGSCSAGLTKMPLVTSGKR